LLLFTPRKETPKKRKYKSCMPNLPEIIQLRQSRYTGTQETRKLDKCGRVLYMMVGMLYSFIKELI
jgi:hypothetical protein